MDYYYVLQEFVNDKRHKYIVIDLEDLVREEVASSDLLTIMKHGDCKVLNASLRSNGKFNITSSYLFSSLASENVYFESDLFFCKALNETNIQRVCIGFKGYDKYLVFSKEDLGTKISCSLNGVLVTVIGNNGLDDNTAMLRSIYCSNNRESYLLNFNIFNYELRSGLRVRVKRDCSDAEFHYGVANGVRKISLLDKKALCLKWGYI